MPTSISRDAEFPECESILDEPLADCFADLVAAGFAVVRCAGDDVDWFLVLRRD